MIFLQQIINGLSLGSMYALIAIGYTMVYGVLRLINFAHGDVMMVGAYIALFCMVYLALPFAAGLLFAILLCALFGILIDKVAYKPLRSAPKISLLITAIGVSFLTENSFNVLFTSTPRSFPSPDYLSKTIEIGLLKIPISTLLIPLLTLILLFALLYVLYKTKYGMAIRAIAFDISTVNLMGINADLIIRIVFALGSGLAAVGGVFWSVNYPSVDPFIGVLTGLKAFAAAVLGGIGSVGGAVIGGFIIGFTEVIVVALLPELAGFKDAFAFVFLIFVLLFRPTGILGYDFEKSRF